MVNPIPSAFAGLEFLATAVLLLDGERRVVYANPAAEVLFDISHSQIVGLTLQQRSSTPTCSPSR